MGEKIAQALTDPSKGKTLQDTATLKAKGMQLVNTGQLAEAARIFLTAHSINRQDVDVLLSLGIINGMLGNYADSEHYLQAAVEINPELAAAYYNLGIAQKYLGKLKEAAGSYSKAIDYDPGVPAYHNNLGNVLLEMHDLDNAMRCFNHALALAPDSADYYYNLGKTLKTKGLRQQAADAYNKALRFRPDFPAALQELGTVYLSLGNTSEAEKCYQKSLAIYPDDCNAISGLANVLARSGRHEQAYGLLEPHLDYHEDSAAIAIAFAGVASHTGRVERAMDLLEQQLCKDISTDSSAQIHFRLGHFHDSANNYQAAFEHFQAGNRLRSHPSGSDDGCGEAFNDIIAAFSRDFFRHAPRSDISSELPVFIVGMPRSGTTLIEQIIASHPRVFGAGELDTLPSLLDTIPGQVSAATLLPDGLERLDRDHITALSKKYIEQLKSIAPVADRVTDKMPANFRHLGFVNLLFPDARVIHCRRNPLDTCLSCYFQDFAGHHPYTNDLEALGGYYLGYERLMKHWKNVLDIKMLDLDYEDLVADFEPTCRRIIDFCGLEWDPRCLEFYKNKRVVVTASADQVNKPLYSRAIGRWKHYEEYLAPLIQVLS